MNKYVCICDGQGGAIPGQGKDLYEEKNAFRDAFDRVNSYISIDAKEVTWGNLKFKTKDNPHYAHVYGLCNQYALFSYLQTIGCKCEVISGHSMGEIIALVLAEIIDVKTGAQLIELRGKLFEKNKKENSEMVALIGNNADIYSCIEEMKKFIPIFIANYNSDRQIVVSVNKKDIIRVVESSAKYIIRAIPLTLGNGCHSPFVQPIENELTQFIENNVEFKKPEIKYFSATFSTFLDDPEQIKENCKLHLLKEVRWNDSMQKLIKMGYTDYIEIGYSKILKGLMLEIDKTINVRLSYQMNADK